MSKATSRSQATGHPVGMGGRKTGKVPPPKVDFKYLGGLGGRVEQELRKTEDALLDYIDAEKRRESLYADQQAQDVASLEAKYPALRGEVRL